jgi:hypothetical protein
MSLGPNQPSQSSKSASPSPPKAETQANSAPEPSSPAETMTDQSANSMLVTPPTRMTPSDDAASEQDLPKTAESPPPEVSSSPSSETDTPAAETPPAAAAPEKSDANGQPAPNPRHQPIPPASEPMQYRAIGLVRGKYTPSEEQFTRGSILTDDEVVIDAVLLGRVMSLVKKHINLEESHLWVVYPRTRERDLELHMQIVGVWEPDKLNRPAGLHGDDTAEESEESEGPEDMLDAEDEDFEDDEAPEASAEDTEDTEDAEDIEDTVEDTEDTENTADPIVAEATIPSPEPEAPVVAESATDDGTPGAEAEDTSPTDVNLPSPDDLNDRYFSVRGEVVYQSEEEQRLLVKIRRSPKQGSTQAKAFKVALKGVLDGKALGYFWDLQVQRQDNELVITEATQIGMVPPQKRRGDEKPPRRGGPGSGPRRGGPGSGPPRKRWQNNREGGRPSRGDRPVDRPISSDRPSTPPTPRQPISKPIKRRPKDEES